MLSPGVIPRHRDLDTLLPAALAENCDAASRAAKETGGLLTQARTEFVGRKGVFRFSTHSRCQTARGARFMRVLSAKYHQNAVHATSEVGQNSLRCKSAEESIMFMETAAPLSRPTAVRGSPRASAGRGWVAPNLGRSAQVGRGRRHYSSASMMVSTRVVTAGFAGSGDA